MFRKSNYDNAQRRIEKTQRKINSTAQAIREHEKQLLQPDIVSKNNSDSSVNHLNYALVEQNKLIIELRGKLINRIEHLKQLLEDDVNAIEIKIASIQMMQAIQKMDDEKEHEYDSDREADKADELIEKKADIEKHIAALTSLLMETKNANNVFPFEYLPDEIILYIMAKLEPASLIKLFTVNKAWLAWASDEALWHENLRSLFGTSYTRRSQEQGSYYYIYKLATIKRLMEKYGEFSKHAVIWELILTVFNGDAKKLGVLLEGNWGKLEAEYQEQFKDYGSLASILFYIAIEYGHHDILMLLTSLGFNIHQRPTLPTQWVNAARLTTWSHVAVSIGNVNSLRYLFDNVFKESIHTKYSLGDIYSLIGLAIDSKDIEVYTYIIDPYSSKDIEDITCTIDRENNSYLHAAASKGNFDIFISWYKLIEFDLFDYFKPKNIVGRSNLFHSAIDGNNSAIMRFLVSELDALAEDNPWTAILKPALINTWYAYAIKENKSDIVNYLVDELGATPPPGLLISAIEANNAQWVKAIVSQPGCDVNAVSFQGATPLRLAHYNLAHKSMNDYAPLVKILYYLTKCGAKDNAHDQLTDELKARLEVLLESKDNNIKAAYLGKLISYIDAQPTLLLADIIENILNNTTMPDLESLDGIFLQLNAGVEKATSYSFVIFGAKKTHYSPEIEIIIKHLKYTEWHPDSQAALHHLEAALSGPTNNNEKPSKATLMKKN